jgi:hypothetical protein
MMNEGKHKIRTAAPDIQWSIQVPYHKLRKKLGKMTGMRKQKQLIMFMAGAGGSDKMRLIKTSMVYAKEFCKEINYMFNKRMTVVIAPC